MVMLISERFPLKVLQGRNLGANYREAFCHHHVYIGGVRERRKQNILRTSCWVAVPFHPLTQLIRVRVCAFVCLRVCESG